MNFDDLVMMIVTALEAQLDTIVANTPNKIDDFAWDFVKKSILTPENIKRVVDAVLARFGSMSAEQRSLLAAAVQAKIVAA